MPAFGLVTIPTHYTMPQVELAKWTEGNGFDSLWFGEHTHIPTSRISPFPSGGELPEQYKMFIDPFVGLTAAAVATTTLKVGTSVCLIPEHNPITLAKVIATLDMISGGRTIIGIGGGWNEEELANHGITFKDRWKITRERILAMKEIWRNDVAEYHGKFVDFDPLWQWPKPVQKDGPKILMGAGSKWSPARIADYCEGWLAPDVPALSTLMPDLRDEMAKKGRSMSDLDLSVITYYNAKKPEKTEARIGELVDMGFTRIAMLVNPSKPDIQKPELETLAGFIKRFR